MAQEFRIFGGEYLKFRPYLVKNTFVFVKLYVKEGWTNKETGKKGDPRMQFNNFMLLHDVIEQFARKLTLQLNIKDLSEPYIEDIHEQILSNDGKQALSVLVYESKEKLTLTMPSRKLKVKISPEMLDWLDEKQVYYKLN